MRAKSVAAPARRKRGNDAEHCSRASAERSDRNGRSPFGSTGAGTVDAREHGFDVSVVGDDSDRPHATAAPQACQCIDRERSV